MSEEQPEFGVDWWLVIRVLIYLGLFVLLLSFMLPKIQS